LEGVDRVAVDNVQATACPATTSTPAPAPLPPAGFSSLVAGHRRLSGVEAGVGYQAGVLDNGNRDEIIGNYISGRGYAVNGKLDWQVSPEVFTETNRVSAFTRPIDAGLSWYDTDPIVFGNH
jgi:hypothetical protein